MEIKIPLCHTDFWIKKMQKPAFNAADIGFACCKKEFETRARTFFNDTNIHDVYANKVNNFIKRTYLYFTSIVYFPFTLINLLINNKEGLAGFLPPICYLTSLAITLTFFYSIPALLIYEIAVGALFVIDEFILKISMKCKISELKLEKREESLDDIQMTQDIRKIEHKRTKITFHPWPNMAYNSQTSFTYQLIDEQGNASEQTDIKKTDRFTLCSKHIQIMQGNSYNQEKQGNYITKENYKLELHPQGVLVSNKTRTLIIRYPKGIDQKKLSELQSKLQSFYGDSK